MLIFSFSLLSRHQALNRTPKYKQLLVKSSMALLCTNIFEKLMHTAPKKLHLPFQRQQTWRGIFVNETDLLHSDIDAPILSILGWMRIYTTTFFEFCLGTKLFFINVLICNWIIVCFYFFIDVFRGEPPIPEVLYRPHPDFKCLAASFNTPS